TIRMNGTPGAWFSLAGEEVRRDALERGTDFGVRRLLVLRQPANLANQECVARMTHGPIGQKPVEAAGDRAQRVVQRRGGATADDAGGQPGGTGREKPVEGFRGDETPLEEDAQSFARAVDAELRDDERQIRVVLREARDDAQGAIQRLF